jgi:branched-chain amino acid transport system ATP-binding protein
MADRGYAQSTGGSFPAEEPMLQLSGVSRRFGGLRVIEKLNLTVQPGEVLGVLGPNGAGKSTLFNLIAGVLPPNEGAIQFMGRDVTTMKVWLRRRLGIGRTYQVPKPFAHMSVFENVLVAATHGGGLTIPAGRREAHEALTRTGLAALAAKPAGTLSLLNLKRLELAKAVAAKPKLLLLDEIAGGLTDAECDDLLAILSAIHAQGSTIVWVEHVIHALKRIASRLAVLHFGAIICEGAPQAVLADERVREVYLGA